MYRRSKGLTNFLNRLLRDPLVRQDHILHRFFSPQVSWDEVLHSSLVTNLPKNPLFSSPYHNSLLLKENVLPDSHMKCSILAATNNYSSSVKIPNFLSKISHPDLYWEQIDINTIKFSRIFKNTILRASEKLILKYREINFDLSELGALLNAFSLSELDPTSQQIEKVGQCIDLSHASNEIMIKFLFDDFLSLLQDYVRYHSSLRQMLSFRNYKQIQSESTASHLNRLQEELDQLLALDADAHRLAIALAPEDSSQDIPPEPSIATSTRASNESSQEITFSQDSDFQANHLDPISEDPFSYESNYSYTSQQLEADPFLQFQIEQSIADKYTPSAIPNLLAPPQIENHNSTNRNPPEQPTSIDIPNSSFKYKQNISDDTSSVCVKEEIQKNTTNSDNKIKSLTRTFNGRGNGLLKHNLLLIPSALTTALVNRVSFTVFKLIDYDPVLHRQIRIRKLTEKISETITLKHNLEEDNKLITQDAKITLGIFKSNRKRDFQKMVGILANSHLVNCSEVCLLLSCFHFPFSIFFIFTSFSFSFFFLHFSYFNSKEIYFVTYFIESKPLEEYQRIFNIIVINKLG
ncbi:Sorting nexin-41 [Smittium mucronatum]|uniref:Sorting nexin-41 n=1 Tax=Smittium mucronatum TaxID=133383 RepID=A0A1R0H7V7_9FUNG|nr:Sorting nexin-41 [Smittium mucronatum]